MHALLVAQQQDLGSWIAQLVGKDLIAVLAVGGGILFVMVAVLAKNWRLVRLAELEGSLKQQMLDKGMSAADIEQVLRSSQRPAPNWEHAKALDATPADLPALVKLLADGGYSGEDIERILRAVSNDPLGRDVHGADAAARGLFRERAASVKNLQEAGMSAEDIERVLRTFPQEKAVQAGTPA